ncbi:MAG: 50S ribosomal protein L25 [Phycisphaerae bacterium]|jgi:large subunit ribosomal protein L25|nr:50S ribosomal protein L25 [Phycisphaerae bacterium]
MAESKIPVIKATHRETSGTRVARRLRKTGQIPAVVYGHGEETLPVSVEGHEIELVLLHGERLLELDLEGKSENVLLKEVQYDTFGQDVLHVDLNRVNLDERIEVAVPVVLVGTAEGMKEGGVLQQPVTEIHIQIAVRDLPEEIEVRVNDLKIWDKISLGEVELPAGATLLDDPDEVLCNVIEISEEELELEEEGEAPLQPEVIGEAEEEGEGEGEAAPAEGPTE